MDLPNISTADLRRDRAPFLAEYFGAWAVHLDTFRAAVDRVSAMDLAAHVRAQRRERPADDHPSAAAADVPAPQSNVGGGRKDNYYCTTMVQGGVALVEIRGTLMKQETSLDESTSTVRMRRTIRALANDPDVKGAMILIESPGGTSAGTQELADDIAALAKAKPCHAYIEDLGASAAYWLASQTAVVSTNAQGWVGSIGTYATVCDYSKMAEKEGVKVHVVRAGEFKGAGVPGTPVTDAHLAEIQRLVDQTNAFFLESVERGRGMSAEQVRTLADGRVHIGAEAQKLRLVDHVESLDQAMDRLWATVSKRTTQNNNAGGGNRADTGDLITQAEAPGATPAGSDAHFKETAMEKPNQGTAPSEPKAASMAELKAACPGAPSDFLVEQAEKNATLVQAKDTFIAFQAAQIRSRDEENDKLKAKSEEAPPEKKDGEEEKKDEPAPAAKKHGVKPISSAPAESNAGGATLSASDELDRRVKAAMEKSPSLTRSKAVAQVFAADEELRQSFVAEQKK